MPSTRVGFLEKSHDRFMCQQSSHNNESVEMKRKKAGLKVVHNHNYISKRGRNNVRAI